MFNSLYETIPLGWKRICDTRAYGSKGYFYKLTYLMKSSTDFVLTYPCMKRVIHFMCIQRFGEGLLSLKLSSNIFINSNGHKTTFGFLLWFLFKKKSFDLWIVNYKRCHFLNQRRNSQKRELQPWYWYGSCFYDVYWGTVKKRRWNHQQYFFSLSLNWTFLNHLRQTLKKKN